MLPQVSVVLPCRDAQTWLAETIGSLRRQEGVELELVVVDDGSTDDSLQALHRAWQGAPWPLRLLQTDGIGVSAARNLGWRASRHPLVAFLDADDLALPGRLQRQAELLTAEPGLQQVLCGWRRIDPSGQPLTEVRPWEEGAGFSLQEALRHKAVLPSAWMLRREALSAVGGFDGSLSQAEDVDLLLRLARAGASGAWLREVLCGYRVHAAGASRRALPQVRGLSFVVARHLKALSGSPEDVGIAAEVRYGTRAWLGWYAWSCGDHPLALELWTTALGLSPFPPGLTWVHLAENVVRSAARIGEPSGLQQLLTSDLWAALEARWWRARHQPPLGLAAARTSDLNWQPVYRGQPEAALQAWSDQFRAELEAGPGELEASAWLPAVMARWCLGDGPLGELRQQVLRWCSDLLELQGQRRDPESLRRPLAEILLQWAALCWQEDRRPTHQRLEQSIAVWPTAAALTALARLQHLSSEAGSQALLQLRAKAADPMEAIAPPAGSIPPEDPEPAFWEHTGIEPDRCQGPQCPPCIERLLSGWSSSSGPHGLMHWQPPAQDPNPPDQHSSPSERRLAVLEHGEAWLRPPQRNAWGSTHAVTIADGSGAPLAEFSRRYPQPWPGSCPFLQPAPQPRPPGDPQWIEATVIALVGLSAETYYHWLLEILPTLGWLATHHPQWLGPEVRIWHNGGAAEYVHETLQQACGIDPAQLLDARSLPWIRARRLVAVSPAPFGCPSAAGQLWLRQALLGPGSATAEAAPQRRIWLRRGASARRPVFGEQETLEHLEAQGVAPLDCAGLTVPEQARRLAEASLVITPHGGAMANLVFATAGTTVLELHHSHYQPPYYQHLAQHRQLIYFSQSQHERPPALYRDLLFESPATEPIVLNPERVAEAVRSLL